MGKRTLRNILITLTILAAATVICFFLQQSVGTEAHAPLLFVLAVLFISRFTDGYGYGIFSAMAAVIAVNYIFTYPYFAFNFTITGYPLTFLVMLAVALSVSALTTQIKNQEKIRLESEKEKMRANLLRAVSHDIRTPLTSIAGSASVILENKNALSQDKVMELVANIKEEAQWLVRMVENLLSITRMNTENAKIDKQEELAEEVISAAVSKFEKRFPGVETEVHVPDEILLVPMDATLIEQVLVNLLENSVIHGRTTSRIRIQVSKQEETAVFSVEDNGEGIEESVLPVIFDGNLVARGESSDNKRNMGIGLSVCKSIIKAHRGNMRAENREEGGARMIFTLPMEMEEQHGDQR
ncbi:sensor histidine kinase [Massilistercora timonensis]|uniref:sensor histidine kinase n=1 Tax=Massilistercora timonensis TaxID=2086584 RepID=UPI003AB3B9E0